MAGTVAPRRRPILAFVIALVLLAMGAGVAYVVSDALGIRSEPSERMGQVAPAPVDFNAPPPTNDPAAEPRLSLRMADLGAVGVTANPAEWLPQDDYTHSSRAFADVYMPDPPYIDQAALKETFTEFDEYARHILDEGYNAIAWPGMIEFVTLENVTGGPVYAAGDEHIAKALALREAFEPFWQHAEDLGIKIFLRTDMLALTDPLEQFLIDRFGSLDTTNPELWRVYTDALDELYQAAPALDGILIRVGEAGDIYDVEGWDYFSALAVRTVPAAQAMLKAFTDQAEASDREVIFRTWSVGVGGVGDMHTNPESYEKVFAGIDSPALIVSTKYTLGDFYSWLPLNNTLEQGDQRRIVEFQSRREYEWFGSWPNDLGAEYAWALQQLLAANPNIEGVWGWTQDGGPWRAGPMNLYLKSGFWYFADLNAMHTAALAQNPDINPIETTRAWAERHFSSDPITVGAITEAMSHSREAIEQGLYIQAFAENRVFAIGLEPPPMMWLFEWDILTGDSAVLGVVYSIAREQFDEAIAGGQQAIEAANEMRALVEGTDATTWRSPELREEFLAALDYEIDTLEVLAAYRAMFMYQGLWHDTRSQDAYDSWTQARDAFEARAAEHLQRYSGDVMHPPLNLEAAQLGVDRADRDLAMAWAARALLVVAAIWLALGIFGRVPAARAHWVGATRPWRQAGSELSTVGKVLLVMVPLALLVATRLVQTSFLAPAQLIVTLGAWALFIAATLVLARKAAWPLIATIGGVIVLRCILALGAVSFTGPGGYWFAFWTDPVRRSLYITVAFALFLWTFIAAAWAVAPTIGRRRATGAVLASAGLALAIPAFLINAMGLERALTIWNDQMGLLPWGLSRILGITVHVGIPTESALIAGVFGALLTLVGLALYLPRRRTDARSRRNRRLTVLKAASSA